MTGGDASCKGVSPLPSPSGEGKQPVGAHFYAFLRMFLGINFCYNVVANGVHIELIS